MVDRRETLRSPPLAGLNVREGSCFQNDHLGPVKLDRQCGAEFLQAHSAAHDRSLLQYFSLGFARPI
jgi:hypothetical protein